MLIIQKNIKNIYHYLKGFVVFALQKNVSRHAKALTFSTVLALVPLFTIFLASFASSEWVALAQDRIQDLLIKNLFPKEISKNFFQYFQTIVSQTSQIKTLGIIVFWVTILFLFMDMEDTFKDISRKGDCQKEWYKRVISIVSLFIVPLICLFVLSFMELFFRKSPMLIRDILSALFHFKLLIKIIVLMALTIWFYFLFRYLPHKNMGKRNLWIGALSASTTFLLAQKIFSWYLEDFSTYQLVYGIFSVIPVFLLWVYIGWSIILWGFCLSCYESEKAIKE